MMDGMRSVRLVVEVTEYAPDRWPDSAPMGWEDGAPSWCAQVWPEWSQVDDGKPLATEWSQDSPLQAVRDVWKRVALWGMMRD